MPNIQIMDGYGLDLQATPNASSAFAKYFQKPPSFSVLERDLASLQDVPLVGFPLQSTEVGLSYVQPTSVAATSPQFTGGFAVSGTLTVITNGRLFDPDPYQNPIEIPDGHAYLGLGVKVALPQGPALALGKTAFGFAGGATVCLSHYKCFEASATTPTFKAALQASFENFAIPLGPDDLFAMGVNDVATIDGTGTLKLSGTVNLLTSVNPLVAISSAALPGTIQINEGATIDVTASYTIEGDFQVRIQKLDAGTVRMGFYRKLGGDFTVQVSPSLGVSAGTTNVDFISALLGAIGPDPVPSADQFEKAGLTQEKQEAITDALKTAIQRKLELSLQAELQALSSREAAFLYDVSLNDLGADGRAVIQAALRLDLSTLPAPQSALSRVIREVRSILTTTRMKGHTLKINILGIYNYASISDLTLKGTVLTDPVSGEVAITDSANATRISGTLNFLADPEKLRKVLAQSFLITAAYRCSGLIAHSPSLKVSYWHFAEHATTDHQTMAANLNILQTLGLITAAQEQQGLTKVGDYGRSTLYLNTDYDDLLSQSLFLRGDGQPRGLEEYEQIGRKALQLLIQSGGEDEFRLRALQSEAVWQQVKDTGGTLGNLAELFPDLRPDLQIPIIAGDFVLVEWWATTMAHMAQSLSAAKQFFSQNPPPATGSPSFEKVRADLWHEMADVSRNTHDRFSDPWGLLAMDLACGQQSMASAQMASSGLTLSVERTKTMASAGSHATAVG